MPRSNKHVILLKSGEQFEASWNFIQKTDITDVRLVGSSTKCTRSIDSVSGPLLFDFGFHPGGSRIESDTVLIVTTFHFKAYEKGNRGESVIVVNCKLEGGYTASKSLPTQEEIDAYARGNAIFNCWSFFREFLSNTVARMGFPPPTLPFLELLTLPEHAQRKKPKRVTSQMRGRKRIEGTTTSKPVEGD